MFSDSPPLLHLPMNPSPSRFESEHVRIVGSFAELLAARFEGSVNAFCWPRTLPGDFAEVARALEKVGGIEEGINALDEDELARLALSAAGQEARGVMLEDVRRLRESELWPELSCVRGGLREPRPGPFVPEVYSWHVDSATVEADTWLCTYHGAASEGLANEEAQRRVDVPETRTALRQMFTAEHMGDGGDESAFAEWLHEHCYDLHYAPVPGARPHEFGLGNLWRIATEWDGSPVPPCIHRAPETLPGMPTRLLLLS